MRTRTSRSRLLVEPIEGREVTAGAVTTAVNHGNFVIIGDAADSQVAPGQVTVFKTFA